MIVVLTETPDELAHELKSYFLINSHYVILTVESEIDENLDSWMEAYDGVVDESTNHISFNAPFLVIIQNTELLDPLCGSFIFNFFHEIEDINSVMDTFIKCGFLPLDRESIINYMNTTMDSSLTNDDKVLILFQRLGYIDKNNSPTPKLIASLFDNDETVKYANVFMVIVSNPEIPTTDERFKRLLLDALKYVDYNIYASIQDAQNKNND